MRAPVHLRLVALLCWAAPLSVRAHVGPEAEIEELTERMKQNGESANLLTERAIEYRVLGKLAEATADLDRAAALAPLRIAVHRELARVLFLGGKAPEALAAVARGLALKTDDSADIADLRMLRAEILRSQNEHKKALDDCDAALRVHKQNPEWYLFRSDLQRQLKMNKERLAGLDEGLRETGAGILQIERVEALIDAAQFAVALPVIETELADSRIKGSWLIRRARVQLGLGKKTEAERDLRDALKEIDARLKPKTPDVPLLLNKALAHELLGEKKDAIRAYEEARDKGIGDTVNEKIKALQEPAPAAKP